MNPWLETAGVVGLGGVGVALGVACARARRTLWLSGCLLALAFFLLCAVGAWWHRLEFLPPLSLLGAGRVLLVVKAAAGAFLLAALVPRLALARDRWALGLVFGLVVLRASAWPFLAPAFNQSALADLATQFDADGICRQNTTYTCGPAAAVTALKRLGLAADEGDLAIRCHTSAALGTPPNILADTLHAGYGPAGLTSEYRWFDRATQLPRDCPTIVLMRFGWFLDHYVAVIGHRADRIVVGDPLLGQRELTLAEFETQWRHVGIVLARRHPIGQRPVPRRSAPAFERQASGYRNA